MPAFSFTAPLITEEQEKAEWEALSPKQREQLRLDMYGSDDDDPFRPQDYEDAVGGDGDDDNDNAVRRQRLSAKVQELKDVLLQSPESETRAYRQALRLAPEVVSADTDYAAFLWVEQNNVLQAAKRVAQYWQLRCEIFGASLTREEDNDKNKLLPAAFCPMTLNGAMAPASSAVVDTSDDDDDDNSKRNKENNETSNLLALGLAFLLPDDRHGRSVMFIDRTRFTSRVAHRDAMLRVLFYVMHAITQRTNNKRRNEVVLLINVKAFDLYKHFDRILTKKSFRMLDVLPWKLKCAHYCSGPGSSVLSIVMPIIKQIMNQKTRAYTQVQSGSDMEVMEKLKEFGLDEVHALPLFRGAIYNQEQCAEFLRQQKLICMEDRK